MRIKKVVLLIANMKRDLRPDFPEPSKSWLRHIGPGCEAVRPRDDICGRVLHIDDNRINRLLIVDFMAWRPNVELVNAVDGWEGLQAAMSAPPDLVLLDIVMPGFDGFSVLQSLRADPSLQALPCIAISASAMPDDIARARVAGFDGYLTKPVCLSTFLTQIDQWLPQTSLR